MNIFLTGSPRVGKSTLIQKFLREHPELKIGGFCTVCSICGNNGIHIVPADCPGAQQTSENLVGIRRDGKTPLSFPAVFDRVGVELLNATDCDLIIMDELGIMESEAKCFQAAVLAALDGETPVLGVIKPKSTPFLDAVRAHEKTVVVEITNENRNFFL